MQRGEVWWAEFPKPVGRRPVLLVSRQRALHVRAFVLVAQITTTIRDLPVEVLLGFKDGLPKRCVVNCDVLTTVPKQLLHERLCLLRPEKLAAVNTALAFALGLT
jgi:mRNA interferase MazF